MNIQLEQREYNVSEISNSIKFAIEENFSNIKVKGEISGLKYAPSGHLYFSLKDQNSILNCICWRGNTAKLNVKPEDGLEVICKGSITTYAGQSKYQLIVSSFEHSGVGALMQLIAKRKEMFEKEGLFDASRKMKIPYFSNIIGIITSPTGAVIKDMIHRIEARMPSKILLWPTLVQGSDAAEQIAKAIEGLNNLPDHIIKPDVIIIARGGGSLEDLYAFNEEILIRAVGNSKIPIISAIGHETDTNLIDYVSDLRAPTPTAAAEFVTPVKIELISKLEDIERRLNFNLNKFIDFSQQKLDIITRSLPRFENDIIRFAQKIDSLIQKIDNIMSRVIELNFTKLAKLENIPHPRNIIEIYKKNLEIVSNNLKQYFTIYFQLKEQKLENFNSLIESYSHHKTLKRGFAIITDSNNNIIDSIENLNSNFTIELKDGSKNFNFNNH